MGGGVGYLHVQREAAAVEGGERGEALEDVAVVPRFIPQRRAQGGEVLL